MNRIPLLLVCLFLPACALIHRFMGPPHAPPEEAAKVEFPPDLPADSRTVVSGAMATAMQLALDDFRPLWVQPHAGATAEEACLYQRSAYDVIASPGPGDVMFVRITLRPEVCESQGPILDVEATYAVDVRGWRILAIRR
jgi:hypothetical protein